MDYSKLKQCSSWRADIISSQSAIDEKLRPWLADKGSLTSALTALSDNNFQVRLLNQKVAVPYLHEQQKLNYSENQTGLIREVELHIHDQAVVFARSIIPLELTNARHGSLDKLGTKPLGHLLFKEGKARVVKREFARIEVADQTILARRTPYEYQDHQVLVSEFFLPSFLSFI